MTTVAKHPINQVSEVTPIYDASQLPNRRKWTRAEYSRAWQSGVFGQTKVELINGEIIVKAPRSPQRATAIVLASQVLWRVFAASTVRIQMPLVVSDISEPDLAVVAGQPRDYPNHPSAALLTMQISTDTLASDLGVKAALYAQAQVPEYWVVDINARLLHVHRMPIASDSLPNGYGYQSVMRLTETDNVSSLAAPQSSISIADLLL